MTSAGAARQLAVVVDWQHPYPGLKAFGEADSIFFFGREAEERELFRLVKRSVLTTCFGASGLGKTSLLNAGLFPQLRAALFFPIAMRLDFSATGGDLVVQVKQRIMEEAEHGRIEAPEPESKETLWEYFHRAHFWDQSNRLLMPVLVLDQFEEIFTLGAGNPHVKSFWQEMSDLIENRIPTAQRDRLVGAEEQPAFSLDRQHYRVLLSLREDYLPELEDLRPLIPSLGKNRFRLTAMDGTQALEAIVKPGKEIVTEDVALEILRLSCGRDAKNRTDLRTALGELRVEPTLLSLFCHEFNNRRTQAGLKQITADLLKGSSDQIVSDFYERCLKDRKPAVRAFVEKQLLTGSGFRRAEAVEEATRLPGVTAADIDELVNRRLLRTETRLGIPHVELTHDVLTGIVAESRDRRLHDEARHRLWWRFGIAAAVCLAVILVLGTRERTAQHLAVSAHEEAVAETKRAQQEQQWREEAEARRREYLDLLKEFKKLTDNPIQPASADLQKLRQQATQAEEQDVCTKYYLCNHDRASWRREFLRKPKAGTWHVIVLSLTSRNPRDAEAGKKMFQARFPNQDFEVLDTASAEGGNGQYAVVIAQGLEDPAAADRIVGFAREANIEKGAFKRQRR